MSTQLFGGWRNERIGLVNLIGDVQLAVLGVAALPMMAFMLTQRWAALGVYLAAWLVLVAVVAVPIRERPAWLWLAHVGGQVIARVLRVGRWQARAAAEPLSDEQAQQLDLPGPLQGFEVFDGPAYAHSGMRRLVVLKDPAGAWTVVAKVEHPGLSLTDPEAGIRWAGALGDLLSAVSRSNNLPSRVSVYVRTVPDDGAERARWLQQNRPEAPTGGAAVVDIPAQVVADADLVERSVLAASVSHEVYVACRFREDDIAGQANASGRGFAGRAAVIYRALPELTDQLTGAGASQVTWLSKGELAAVIRTGFNPAAGQSVQVAKAAAAQGVEMKTDVTPAAAGPSQTPSSAARFYTHDGFRSVAYSIVLPELGTRVGSLGPMLTPQIPGERRCVALHYEPLDDKAATREAGRASTNAFLAQELKAKKGFSVSERSKRLRRQTSSQEKTLADGHTLVRVTGVAVVTAPLDEPIETHSALLEAAARQRKFELMRLDLAQPIGFIAGCLPVAVGMPSQRKRK